MAPGVDAAALTMRELMSGRLCLKHRVEPGAWIAAQVALALSVCVCLVCQWIAFVRVCVLSCVLGCLVWLLQCRRR